MTAFFYLRLTLVMEGRTTLNASSTRRMRATSWCFWMWCTTTLVRRGIICMLTRRSSLTSAAKRRGVYYGDYADSPVAEVLLCFTEGCTCAGEGFRFRHGNRRGERRFALQPDAFIAFLQNHAKTGNRAFGDRLSAIASSRA